MATMPPKPQQSPEEIRALKAKSEKMAKEVGAKIDAAIAKSLALGRAGEMIESGMFRYLDIFEPAKIDRIDRWARAEGIERQDAIRRIIAAGLATIPK